MKRLHLRRAILGCGSLVLLFAVATTAVAKTNEANYSVKSTEVVGRNIYKAAQTIEIDGTVHGDVIVAAQTVRVNGTIEGDLIAAAETVRVSGVVKGDVIAVANTIEVEGTVGGDLRAVGQNIEVFPANSTVEKNVTVFGKNAIILGTVLGNAFVAGDTVSVANVGGDFRASARSIGFQGAIDGNVIVDAEEDEDQGKIQLLSGASVAGDFEYSGVKPDIDDGATISGAITEKLSSRPRCQNIKIFGAFVWFLTFFKTVSTVGMMIVALLIVALFGERLRMIMIENHKQLWWNFAVGLMLVIITPIVLVLLAVTLVGLPLALIGGALYAVKIYLAKVLYGIALGHWIMSRGAKDKKSKPNLYAAAVIGTFVLSLVSLIPFLGPLIVFSGIVWMLGAGMSLVLRMVKKS